MGTLQWKGSRDDWGETVDCRRCSVFPYTFQLQMDPHHLALAPIGPDPQVMLDAELGWSDGFRNCLVNHRSIRS